MKLAIVIPAYNEGKTVGNVIKKIPKIIKGINEVTVIVVDDNSVDNTGAVARSAGARVIRHKLNLGYGGANITGLTAAYKWDNDIAITLDADGQHDPEEIIKFVEHYISTKSNFIAGSRLISGSDGEMPLIRRLGNRFFIYLIYIFSRARPTDSQSGYRLLDKEAMEIVSEKVGSGYEFTSELIIQITKAGLRYSEIPIKVIYDKGRKGGQNPLNGINIIFRLVYRSLVG